ncbi:hypothetical protein ACUSIJ_13495 [Pseudochelatococcus sp. B33]
MKRNVLLVLAFACGLGLRPEAGLAPLPVAVAQEQSREVPEEAPQRIFPPGLGIGLVPPEDMRLSVRFPGFEDEARESAIMMSELPPELFASMEKDLREPSQEPEGFKLISREAWPVEGGRGILVAASQVVDGETIYKWVLARGTSASAAAVTFQVSAEAIDYYTDEVVRRTLRSLALRDHAQLLEEVGQLPFVVDDTLDDDTASDHIGFRIARVIPGNSVMMTSGPKDLVQGAEQPVIVVSGDRAAIVGKLEQDRFARQSFASLAGVRGMQVRRGEGVTRDGVDWHEMEADGQDSGTGAKVRVFQAIRFERSDFIRFVLVTRDNSYEEARRFFERLREGVTPRTDVGAGGTPAGSTPQ